jgi:cytochrome P450
MFERFPNMRLDTTVDPKWKENLILRGPQPLPVRF